MNRLFAIICIGFIVVLSGCTSNPQKPVKLSKKYWDKNKEKIGIVLATTPEMDTHIVGANCLLCMMTAAAVNSTLTDHMKTLSPDSLPELKTQIQEIIKAKGGNPVVIDRDINVESLPENDSDGANASKRDFSMLATEFGVSKMLVIDMDLLGAYRTYASYVPTSDPVGAVQGKAYIVNLSDNTYEWYLPLNIKVDAGDNWDEPPSFPGVTNAFYTALEQGKDAVISDLR